MQVLGSYDIINTIFNYGTSNSQTSSPFMNNMFKGIVVAKYSQTINDILSKDVNTFMKSLSSQIGKMSSSINSLLTDDLTSHDVSSSDSTKADATALKDSDYSSFTVSISQLAETQENTSAAFTPDETSDIEPGNQSFQVNFDTQQYNFNIEIKSYDTNRTVLSKVSSQINSANIGINAQVTETEEGQINLQITSNDTGEINGFSFSGDFANDLDLNNVTQNPKDAIYELNDESLTSDSNTVTTGDQAFQIQLKEKTDDEVTFEVQENTKAAIDKVSQFVDNFNSFKTYLNSESSNRQVDMVSKQINGLVKKFGDDFKDLGITIRKDGTLKLDQAKLQKASEENINQVKNLFTDKSSFGDQLKKKMDRIENIPSSTFVQEKINTSTSSQSNHMFAYFNNAQKMNLMTLQNQGSLLDLMI